MRVRVVNKRIEDEMSNLIKHLDREWKAMGWPTEGDDDPQVWLYRHMRKLLKVFDEEGHSGTSAPYAVTLFRKLAMFEPDGSCFTSFGSRTPVTFPYTPTTEYVDVPADA